MEADVDCTASCRLLHHGNLLAKCLTKRGISEEKLISFLVLSCGNFSRNLDENGRSALHIACSNSKPLVAEFLLKNNANIHQKDIENNWSPLHRSIHYACLDVAVMLKRYGASFDTLDSDFFTPLQLIPKFSAKQKTDLVVYVWGKNKNYNIGIGNITSRNQPDMIKEMPTIAKASVNKYHSLFLSTSGELFGCGHSKEGRLGTGSEVTLTSPQKIPIKFSHKNEKIIEVSAGLSHSLILTNKAVYGAGSNKHLQLGMKNDEIVMSFKEIPFHRTEMDLKSMITVIATDFHSLFVSRTSVFVCGLNVGQFAGIQESIATPRRLPYPVQPNQEVIFANTNNACICVYVNDWKSFFLHIFCNRKMKTYKNPLNEKLKQCAISGGELLYNSDEVVKYSSQKPLTLTILTEHNNLWIWYEDIMQFVKVHLSSLFTTQISFIASCGGDDLLFLANDHIFQATIQHKVQKLYHLESQYQEFSMKRDVAQFLCSKTSIRRVQHLSNVKKFYCDPDGESFIAILAHAKVNVKEPEKENFDFSLLLDDYQFIDSGIMDFTFEIKNETFKVNRFLMSSRCIHLRDMIQCAKNGVCIIEDNRLTPEMFQVIVTWIYKNSLTEDEMKVISKSSKDEITTKKIFQDFHDLLTDWKLSDVQAALLTSKAFNKFLPKSEVTTSVQLFKWFSLKDFPEFYDVTILLDENQQLRAHKVILMMRIEYFKMMFYHSWSETSTIDLRHVPINFMRPIIQFAYDNDAEALKTANFSDNYMYNMVAILDQYLIEDLKHIFESMIMRKVNLRNCAENLDFSFMYNCHLLKDYCMEFICLNLSRLLESSVLESLDVEILKELSLFYRKYFKFETDSSHIITPVFDAPSDEEIEKAIKGFDLSSYAGLQQPSKKTPKSKNKLSKSEILKRNYEKEGMKMIKNDEVVSEPTTPKSPEASTEIVEDQTWQRNRERKDSGKRKVLTAIKVNEIMKNETAHMEPMVDLKSFRNSLSEEPETTRNSITLADFGFKTKKKTTIVSTPPVKVEQVEVKPAWNMDNVQLMPQNQQVTADPFKATPTKSKNSSPKPSSTQKNFTSIVRDERKDKSNYEKIKSKSLILTQIEEKAIMELSEFYNIDNIFDENITIQRKLHVTNQNLSQHLWQHQSNGN